MSLYVAATHSVMSFYLHVLFQKMVLVRPSDAMRSVRILGLLTAPNRDFVTGLLKCFPCVEKLHIVVRYLLCSVLHTVYVSVLCGCSSHLIGIVIVLCDLHLSHILG